MTGASSSPNDALIKYPVCHNSIERNSKKKANSPQRHRGHREKIKTEADRSRKCRSMRAVFSRLFFSLCSLCLCGEDGLFFICCFSSATTGGLTPRRSLGTGVEPVARIST
ncbi:hypothetical protein FTUN_8606 [Frigoriglobus tundricola]|uniref:Uncharacterized protein n=1 Tax=Frigoriglobus tundricola TaxID=2774151 RepID=A0A6M5Z3H8_9BACT|nr:hypothetical protein FTUN_8606 [Frigoriglobus tundricola]